MVCFCLNEEAGRAGSRPCPCQWRKRIYSLRGATLSAGGSSYFCCIAPCRPRRFLSSYSTLLWRGLRDRRYFRRVGERFGFVPFSHSPTDGGDAIWLHAVSVGRGDLAGGPDRRHCARRFRGRASIVSCTTLAGGSSPREKAPKLVGWHLLCSVRFRLVVRRVLRRLAVRAW